MEALRRQLEQEAVGRVLTNEPLKNHTTWRIGGPADLFVQPKDKASLIRTMRAVFSHQLPYRIIGRGSNLLVRDGGIRGVVIKVGHGVDSVHVEGQYVTVGSGYSFIKFAMFVAKKGLSGLEFAGGIPGTVGGAVFMNAGAHGSDVSNILHQAEVIFEDGQVEKLTNEQMEYEYRTSVLQHKRKGICLEATFRLKRKDPQAILKEMATHKGYRRKTQPLQQPCCGSVFRNPLPHSAGRLIEQSGLKGYRIGDAQVSPLHANFIVNRGQAKAAEVLALIQHIQQTVRTNYTIDLHPEVQVLGEDGEG